MIRNWLIGLHLLLTSLVAAAPLSTSTEPSTSSTFPPQPPLIDPGYMHIQGYYNSTDQQHWWKGIRYAVADRFQTPRTPAADRRSIANTTSYGNICWQATAGGLNLSTIAIGEQSEDCLFLSINAPASVNVDSRLPVLVWIHGGGYAIGSAGPGSDFSAFLTNAGNNIVAVAIQYRVGAFGFLAGQEMAEHGVLNAGLLDQQFALQWVQEHILKFGGDPDHVTIWGDSAGGGSVMNHIVANGGNTQRALGLEKPLFHAAIGSSVFIVPQLPFNSTAAEAVFRALAETLGCHNGTASRYECLRQVEASALAKAAQELAYSQPFGVWTFVPVLEGGNGFLRERASVFLARNRSQLNGERYMSINNLHEGLVFTNPELLGNTTLEPAELERQFETELEHLFPMLDASDRAMISRQYPLVNASDITSTFERISLIYGDALLVCPGYWTAEAFGTSAWKGIFAYGASTHGIDAEWYLGPIWNGRHSESALNSFTGCFEGFIQTYDPNNNLATYINPYWPTYDSRSEMYFEAAEPDTASQATPRIVNTSSQIALGVPQLERCKFWRDEMSARVGF